MYKRLLQYKELESVPFDPVSKRTVVSLRSPEGAYLKVAKGAPQVILRMAHNMTQIKDLVDSNVNELASRGFRALGVCVSHEPEGVEPVWNYVAVLSLFDP